MKVTPYLLFNGNCEEAFKFYESSIGAKIVHIMTHGNSPMAEGTPAEMRDKVLHASLKIDDAMLFASDAPPARYEKPAGFSVTLNVDTPEEAERIFSELSAKGEVHMPIQETFWAHRFGMLVDHFGIPWMIDCEKPMQ